MLSPVQLNLVSEASFKGTISFNKDTQEHTLQIKNFQMVQSEPAHELVEFIINGCAEQLTIVSRIGRRQRYNIENQTFSSAGSPPNTAKRLADELAKDLELLPSWYEISYHLLDDETGLITDMIMKKHTCIKDMIKEMIDIFLKKMEAQGVTDKKAIYTKVFEALEACRYYKELVDNLKIKHGYD